MTRVCFDMQPSKYKHRGIQIYRADIRGGTLWMFSIAGKPYISDSLYWAKIDIEALLMNPDSATAAKMYSESIGLTFSQVTVTQVTHEPLSYESDNPICPKCGVRMLKGLPDVCKWVCGYCGYSSKKVRV